MKYSSHLRPLLRAVLIVAAYFCVFIILDYFSHQFEILRGVVAWYPPAGLTYALLLVFGVRFAPAVMIALFISALFIYRMPQQPYFLFLWAFIVSLIYSLAAAFLRKLIRFDWQLQKVRDVAWLVATAVFVSALLAVLSVSASFLSSEMPRSEVLRAIFHWWIGETVGILTVTPFLLIYVMPGLKKYAEGLSARLPERRALPRLLPRLLPRPSLSVIGQAFSIALTLYWVFGLRVLDEFRPMYLITLPLIWIALLQGIKGASWAILVLNSGVVFALWLFKFDLPRLGGLELLMVVNCVVGLLMGAVVTERRRAETALKMSKGYLDNIVNFISDPIFVKDDDFRFTLVNNAFCDMLGMERKDIIGSTLGESLPEDQMDHFLKVDRMVFESGVENQCEELLTGHDGKILTLITKKTLYVDEQGGKFIVGVIHDITNRKQAEVEILRKNEELLIANAHLEKIMHTQERSRLSLLSILEDEKLARTSLRESEEKYRAIIETIPDAYFEVDLAGHIIFFNDQYSLMTGYTKEELQGLSFRKLSDSKSEAQTYKAFHEVYLTGKPAMHVQLELIHKAGNRNILELSISRVSDQQGKPVGFRGVARDITEKRQQEVLSFHSQKLESVGQLAAGIAHEINTPIQFIGDNIHFIKGAFQDILSLSDILNAVKTDDLLSPAVVKDLLSRIREKEKEIDLDFLRQEMPQAIEQSLDGLQRVSRIVQAMREFSHPGGEGMSDMDINKAIESTITLTKNEWKYSAELTTTLAPDLPVVQGYPADFNQVILNLIVNAAQSLQEKVKKDGAEKESIEIFTRRDGNEVEICIRDTGPGIPPEIQSRIFDPFFTTKAVGKGTGQGLAIAQNIIVRKHGGKIFFETKPGEGTAFYIRLPLDKEQTGSGCDDKT